MAVKSTSTAPEEMKPYKQRANEITTEGNHLLQGINVIIKEKLQGGTLRDYTRITSGSSSIKAIARSFV